MGCSSAKQHLEDRYFNPLLSIPNLLLPYHLLLVCFPSSSASSPSCPSSSNHPLSFPHLILLFLLLIVLLYQTLAKTLELNKCCPKDRNLPNTLRSDWVT